MDERLAETRVRLERLRGSNALTARSGTWSVGQIFVHCAESIECSMRGFPTEKARIVQWTVGAVALRVFLARGSMSHDRNATLPGGAEPAAVATDVGLDRLLAAIDELARFDGTLARHVLFGAVSKADYERYHAIHIADHLSEIDAPSATPAGIGLA
jgi:hypothetical protein